VRPAALAVEIALDETMRLHPRCHFALETEGDTIAGLMREFLGKHASNTPLP
jgi:hypothetical protein